MLPQIKYLFPFLMVMIFFIPFSHSEDLEIKVERLEKNLFKIEGKAILIQTQNCDAMDQHEAPFLKINETSKTIHFRKPTGKCAVKTAYKLSDEGLGSYSVIIRHEEDDWYGISSTDSFIRTKECASPAQGQKAILSMNGTHGTLIIGQLECRVEGVYTRIE